VLLLHVVDLSAWRRVTVDAAAQSAVIVVGEPAPRLPSGLASLRSSGYSRAV